MDSFMSTMNDGSEALGRSESQGLPNFGFGGEIGIGDTQVGMNPPLDPDVIMTQEASKAGAKKVNTKPKLPNFGVENKILISSWLNVSTDPIISTGKKKESYWKNIAEKYNSRGEFLERTQKSLNNRWDFIKEHVSKFAGYYQQVLHKDASGLSDADKTSQAHTLYKSMEGKAFTLSHCGEVLKDEKWNDLCDKTNKARDGIACDSKNVSIDVEAASDETSRKRPHGSRCSQGDKEESCISLLVYC